MFHINIQEKIGFLQNVRPNFLKDYINWIKWGTDGAGNTWSDLIWSTKPVKCWWHSLRGAAKQTGNLRDMGGRLIRWWWGERRTQNLIGSRFEFLPLLMPNHESFFLDYPVVLILGCPHVCMWVCIYAWECELLSWWETGREEMCMVGLQQTRWALGLAKGHLTSVTVQTEPCRTNHCHGDGLWIPFIFQHRGPCYRS